MSDSEPERPIPPETPAEHELLARLLDLSPPEAARIRASTPARRRARRQVGPSADYGGE